MATYTTLLLWINILNWRFIHMPNTLTPSTLVQKSPGGPAADLAVLQRTALHNTTPLTPVIPHTTPSPTNSRIVTKYEFRLLFTTNERIAIDNASTNTSLPAPARAAMVTLLKDLEVSGTVDLDLPQVHQGVTFLSTLGLIAPSRVAQILSNQYPTA